MFSSPSQWLIPLAIVAVIFGARKLPEIGKGVGEAIKNFKKAISEQDHIDVTPKKDETAKAPEEAKKDKPA